MPVFQDSGAINLADAAGTVAGAPAENGLVRIQEVEGPWVIRARVVYPTPQAGPGAIAPVAFPPFYLKILEGRNRAQARFETIQQTLIVRDFAWQASASTIDVACVSLRPGNPGVPWTRAVLHSWAVKGTLSRIELATLMSEFSTVAALVAAINAGYDASIPAYATSCEITLPTVAQGPIPANLDFVQLFADGTVAVRTPVSNLNRPFVKVPLASYARFAALVDPAAGVGHAGIPVTWICHA